LLKLAGIYVYASNFEGLGITAVGAMSAGLPVVASEVPELKEVVKAAGRLVLPSNEEVLPRAISQILRSSQIRQRMPAASQKRAGHFTIDGTVDALINLYESFMHART